MNGKNQETQPIQYPEISSSSPPPPQASEEQGAAPSSSSSSAPPATAEKWGTHVMGTPAVPTCHPNNQKAALWGVGDQKEYQNHHQPYIQYTPIEKNSNSVLHKFNTWSAKAETTANNIWQNLKVGSSVSGAAWGKMNLGAKAITGGGFESLYKQTFATYPNETLKIKDLRLLPLHLHGPRGGDHLPLRRPCGLLQRPPPLLHGPLRPGDVELLQDIDSTGEDRKHQSCRDEGEPDREIHTARLHRRPRFLVHGLCQLRESNRSSL